MTLPSSSFEVNAKGTEISVAGDISLQDLFLIVKDHWPRATMDDISMCPEHRHVRCLDYDLYDSSDYEDYIVLTLLRDLEDVKPLFPNQNSESEES